MSAPHVFLGYQQRWAADPVPVKVIEKSRRIGLTWAEAGDDALYAAEELGDDVWYIGYNKEMAEEFISEVAAWAKRYKLAAGEVEEEIFTDEDKDILTYRVRFASGHKVVALSSRPSNLRGKQGRVVIDEAAFHDDLGELLKAAMALLMWGGEVRVISTHDGEDNPFNELVNDIRAGRLKGYSLHRVTLDDALADGLYQRICLVTGKNWSPEAEAAWRQELVDRYGDDADEELFCIPSQGSGTYLTRTLIERCMSRELPVLRLAKDDDFTFAPEHTRIGEIETWCEDTLAPLLAGLDPARLGYVGQDFGRSGDLSIIMPLIERQNATFYAPCVIELHNIPFKQQEQILFYLINTLPRFGHAALDARGNGQYLAEVTAQKYGAHRVSQVMLSESWYRDNMPRYKAAFEDQTIELPRDADIIADHRALKIVKGVARLPETRTTGADTRQRHGDAAIAGALAWYATDQEGGAEVEYESLAKNETFGDARGMW
jgi:phage FluMu gp28-like protein